MAGGELSVFCVASKMDCFTLVQICFHHMDFISDGLPSTSSYCNSKRVFHNVVVCVCREALDSGRPYALKQLQGMRK